MQSDYLIIEESVRTWTFEQSSVMFFKDSGARDTREWWANSARREERGRKTEEKNSTYALVPRV